jgi:hypothetical protein
MLKRMIFLTATITTALIALPFSADAQQKVQRGGAPAAPHIAAPRMAAPHAAAPMAPRMGTPHIAAPRAATPQHMGSSGSIRGFHGAPPVNRGMAFHGAPAIHRGSSSGSMARGSQRAFSQRALESHRTAPSVAASHAYRGGSRIATRPISVQRQHALQQRETIPQSTQRAVTRQPAQGNTQMQQRTTQMQKNVNGIRGNAAGVTPQAARQGRFAAAFANTIPQQTAARFNGRNSYWAARQAWRRGLHAAFVPWYGPVFWPYAYSDIFDYAFWPYGYDDGFWAFAYDDFFDGVFWGEYGPPPEYAYGYDYDYGYRRSAAVPRASYAAVRELCTQPGNGVTAWPFAELERSLRIDVEQKHLLDDVRAAAREAADEFRASCPAQEAGVLTPPNRLAAMTARLQATLQAVQTVRPALEKFYNSLSDEQKERFNEIGPKMPNNSAEASMASANEVNSCKQPKPGLTNLPIEKIDDVIRPTEAQEADLGQLQAATNQALSILQQACPDQTPLTPPGRLQVMETRLNAMIDAANTVKPPLEHFYSSLSNEQKARFNVMGRGLAKAND